MSGSFSAPGTQTWTLSLEKGKNYAVYGWADPWPEVRVLATGGKAVAHFLMWDSNEAEGASFRAPYTGRYAVAVTAGPPCPPDGSVDPCTDSFPSSYVLSAARDCPGDTSTPCAIKVGQTLHDLNMSFVGEPSDADWFRTSLKAGRTYVASLPHMTACAYLAVANAAGRLVTPLREECPDTDGAGGPPVAFAPARSGTYFVVVTADDEATPSVYDLSLGLAR